MGGISVAAPVSPWLFSRWRFPNIYHECFLAAKRVIAIGLGAEAVSIIRAPWTVNDFSTKASWWIGTEGFSDSDHLRPGWSLNQSSAFINWFYFTVLRAKRGMVIKIRPVIKASNVLVVFKCLRLKSRRRWRSSRAPPGYALNSRHGERREETCSHIYYLEQILLIIIIQNHYFENTSYHLKV